MRPSAFGFAALLSFFSLGLFAAEQPPSAIRIDQIGYPANAPKLAAVVHPAAGSEFSVHRVSDGETVYRGSLGDAINARDSGETIRLADFSPLTSEGVYELRIEGVGSSDPFTISTAPYSNLLRLATRSYYGQRCGIAVDLAPEFPGYEHAACHLSGGYHASSGRKGEHPSAGGWHDAGDYGRYVVNSGISTGTLLWAWEIFPAALRDLDLAIPESNNDVPDFLDEVRWNLEWMLSMQDKDGGVWHKQTSEDFATLETAPDEDPWISYVVGTGSAPYKSSCATAEFASTMAIASRVYAPFDDAFASRTRDAAMSAWNWLEKHPNVAFRRNPRGVVTGEYADRDCSDERLWAAAEIWRTTGDEAVGRWFVAHSKDAIDSIEEDNPPNWREVGAMAAWTYALSGKGDAATVATIRERSLRAAHAIVERSRKHGYHIPLQTDDYVWGSNGVAAEYGVQLLVANELEPDSSYREAALEIVHYLLGRNPFSLSWVTGAGARPVMHPHHAPSVADDNLAPWPGLLAGGPNRNRQDPSLKRMPRGTPPGKMYVDDEPSYASNEIAINWNAPLVFVLAGVSE
ncbi:MAG: glycoside hydrolase family 9 protein [Thermoanaerobaculia bacterium]